MSPPIADRRSPSRASRTRPWPRRPADPAVRNAPCRRCSPGRTATCPDRRRPISNGAPGVSVATTGPLGAGGPISRTAAAHALVVAVGTHRGWAARHGLPCGVWSDVRRSVRTRVVGSNLRVAGNANEREGVQLAESVREVPFLVVERFARVAPRLKVVRI